MGNSKRRNCCEQRSKFDTLILLMRNFRDKSHTMRMFIMYVCKDCNVRSKLDSFFINLQLWKVTLCRCCWVFFFSLFIAFKRAWVRNKTKQKRREKKPAYKEKAHVPYLNLEQFMVRINKKNGEKSGVLFLLL